MTKGKELQQVSLTYAKIKALLIFLKSFRGINYTRLADALRVGNTYISSVLSENKPASEKFLIKLEQFYLLDNLKRISEIDRQIDDLKREKSVLQEQTIEKFYAERQVEAEKEAERLAALNERKIVNPVPISSKGRAAAERRGEQILRKCERKARTAKLKSPLKSGDSPPA